MSETKAKHPLIPNQKLVDELQIKLNLPCEFEYNKEKRKMVFTAGTLNFLYDIYPTVKFDHILSILAYFGMQIHKQNKDEAVKKIWLEALNDEMMKEYGI